MRKNAGNIFPHETDPKQVRNEQENLFFNLKSLQKYDKESFYPTDKGELCPFEVE